MSNYGRGWDEGYCSTIYAFDEPAPKPVDTKDFERGYSQGKKEAIENIIKFLDGVVVDVADSNNLEHKILVKAFKLLRSRINPIVNSRKKT